MITDEAIDRAQNEHEAAEPLQAENDIAGAAYVRGYSDAYQGKELATPAHHVESYLRGYIAGLQARRE